MAMFLWAYSPLRIAGRQKLKLENSVDNLEMIQSWHSQCVVKKRLQTAEAASV